MDRRTIDVFELARQGRRVEGPLPADAMPRLASMLARGGGTVSASLQGRIDGQGRSGALLQIRATVALVCDRCGLACDVALDGEAGFFFVPDEAHLHAEPITAEGDEPLVGSRHFDWWELVEDQAILCLPISPRHPGCEAAVPLGSGDVVASAERQRPFEALAALKKGRNVVK